MQLAKFLNAHPNFYFDLEEHLRSTTVVPSLRQSMERFVASQSSGATVDSYANFVAESINDGVCRATPAYRRLSPVRRLSDVPFVTKDDLRNRPRAYVSSKFSPEQLWVKNTTGSSGPPMAVFYSADFYFDFLLLSLQKVAYTAGITNAAQRPVFCVAVSGNRACREFVTVDPSRTLGVLVQVLVQEDNRESFERAIRLIEELRPVCVSSKPSVYEMLCAVAPDSLDRAAAPDILVSGGAEMSTQLRSDLEHCFSSRVVDTYGMTEFGVIAIESGPGDMLIDASAFCVEVVDGDGNPMPPGQVGELVITSLKNAAMPLLRYRTGDLGALDTTGTRLKHFDGRKIRCFKLADGALFSPTFFNDIFTRFPSLKEFQLIQIQPSHFQVRVDIHAGNGTGAETLENVRTYVRTSIPGNPTVMIGLGTERTLGKFQRFKTAC